MDSGRTTTFAGGLKLSPENAIEESGYLGTRRGLGNIRWYEYTFLSLGILAALVTDGLTIARLVDLQSLSEPEFAYGILIIVHSTFLLLFLITGIIYQRISDIVAFFLSAVLLTIYVIAHYFTPRNVPDTNQSQTAIRLARLIFTIVFNICFVPLTYLVIKDYDRDEFSKRLFGAFPAARRPLKIYSIFDCVARINTMLSISSLLLNLYNFTDSNTLDTVLLVVGIPLTLLWLSIGIGMARLENHILAIIFYILSAFQIGFLIYTLLIGIQHSIRISKDSLSSTTTQSASTQAPIPNMVPVLQVLYVCVAVNFVTHIMSMVMGYWCTRNFKNGLKERVFNTKLDKWIQQRWSTN